jgi:membrane associated rhomboid family serine protease
MHSFEPLDLVRNEKQRQLFLLPLSVSGMVMTILPAYYLHYKKYYLVLGAQGIIGILLILLFLGISLTPESSTKSIFIPTCEK